MGSWKEREARKLLRVVCLVMGMGKDWMGWADWGCWWGWGGWGGLWRSVEVRLEGVSNMWVRGWWRDE